MSAQPAPSVTDWLVMLDDNLLRPLLEAIDGHRAQMLAHGYSETAAEAAALAMHSAVMEHWTKSMTMNEQIKASADVAKSMFKGLK